MDTIYNFISAKTALDLLDNPNSELKTRNIAGDEIIIDSGDIQIPLKSPFIKGGRKNVIFAKLIFAKAENGNPIKRKLSFVWQTLKQ
jgi:hypothetical protein